MNFQKFPKCISARVKNINRLSSSMLDEVAPTQSSNVYVAFIKISFWSLVVGEKFVFDVAYEEVGVARSHFGSHCNTVDLFL